MGFETQALADQAHELSGRSRVLHAAAELFVSQGYAGTTLRQIASAAGLQAGSIYHHFNSKEALFVAVLDKGIAVMIQAFETAADKLAGGFPAATDRHDWLHAHVHAHLSAVFENGPYTTAHVTSFFGAPPEVRNQVVPIRDSYEQQWNELFDRIFPRTNVKALRLHRLILFGAMNATAEWFDPGGNLSLEQLASTITNQFLNGINSVNGIETA